MPILYSKDAQAIYAKARVDAAGLVQSGYSLDEANSYLRSEFNYALQLDDAQIERNARASGEGHALVHEVLAELLAS